MNKIWIVKHADEKVRAFKTIKNACKVMGLSPNTVYNSTTYKEKGYYVLKTGHILCQIELQ